MEDEGYISGEPDRRVDFGRRPRTDEDRRKDRERKRRWRAIPENAERERVQRRETYTRWREYIMSL